MVLIPALSLTVLLGYVVSQGYKQSASQAMQVKDIDLIFFHTSVSYIRSSYAIEEFAYNTNLVDSFFVFYCWNSKEFILSAYTYLQLYIKEEAV